MTEIKILVRDDCPLCDEAEQVVDRVVGDEDDDGYEVVTENIEGTPALEELYGDEVPVVMIDGVAKFRLYLDEDELRDALGLQN
ncbi:MAG: glutaredoxin family protein [Halobacteria archaeon]|nr:glutaredoxin family protein [Halobacteria archaeon]